LSGTCISFDIGTRNVHAVLGQAEGTAVKILKSANIEIPKGVIADGLITNREGLALAMQEAVSKLNTSSREAVITFNSNSVIIREFEVPAGDSEEVEAMIKNEIVQYFGMTGTDLVEYRKIGDVETSGIKKVKVRAAVMNREIAQGYYDQLDNLRLKPLALDIHPNVISKIFNAQTVVNGNNHESFILMDIGYSGTMIYLFSQGGLQFFRFVNFGGKAIDRLLAGVFSLPEEKAEENKIELLSKKSDLPLVEAVPAAAMESRSALVVKKKGHSFTVKKKNLAEIEVAVSEEKTADTEPVEDQKKGLTTDEAVIAVRPLYGELLEELRKVMQFFLNRSGTKDLNQIYLMGGGASLIGLSDYISQGLGFEVNKLKSISSIQIKDQQALGSLVNAAGAIIRL